MTNERTIVFSEKWFKEKQKILLWFLNTPIISFFTRWLLAIDKGYKVIELLPHCYKMQKEDNKFIFVGHTHNKFAKRLYFRLKPIWWAFHYWDWVIEKLKVKSERLCFGFPTLTVYPDQGSGSGNTTVDGVVVNTGGTYSTVRGGSSGSSVSTTGTQSDIIQNNFTSSTYTVRRGYTFFDTSPLTSDATITSAVISLYVNARGEADSGHSTTYCLSVTTSANNNISASDYNQSNYGSTIFAERSYSQLGTGAYRDFTLSADGISYVNKTGVTKFGWRCKGDYDGSTPTGTNRLTVRFADYSGTSSDPYLVIEYTVATLTMKIVGVV